MPQPHPSTLKDSDLDTKRHPATPGPAVVSVDMGYGHLRAAHPLADVFGVETLRADQPPIAGFEEKHLWSAVRHVHEGLSRLSRLPAGFGELMRWSMKAITRIEPLHGPKNLSLPDAGVQGLEMLIDHGLGRGLVEHVRSTQAPLITTFYAPAIVANQAGLDRVYCVATDADIHRIWAPRRAARARISYFAPSHRVVRRLQAYGVPPERIQLTGFPLPIELLGNRDLDVLRRNLAARIVRLDVAKTFRHAHEAELHRQLGQLPREQEGAPPLVTFAVGGAGAQAQMADEFLFGLRDALIQDRLRLALVAGVRSEVAASFQEALERHRLSGLLGQRIQILWEPNFTRYYQQFNALLAETDVLWTKPSEMTFYAALGLPLVLAKPIGSHEYYNRRWLREAGAALEQQDLTYASGWIEEWLRDGTLAAAAWAGFNRLPKSGTFLIQDALRQTT